MLSRVYWAHFRHSRKTSTLQDCSGEAALLWQIGLNKAVSGRFFLCAREKDGRTEKICLDASSRRIMDAIKQDTLLPWHKRVFLSRCLHDSPYLPPLNRPRVLQEGHLEQANDEEILRYDDSKTIFPRSISIE